jgi:hypothetical protein
MKRITYTTTEDFYNGILELLKRGITFDADASQLKVTLTGGF